MINYIRMSLNDKEFSLDLKDKHGAYSLDVPNYFDYLTFLSCINTIVVSDNFDGYLDGYLGFSMSWDNCLYELVVIDGVILREDYSVDGKVKESIEEGGFFTCIPRIIKNFPKIYIPGHRQDFGIPIEFEQMINHLFPETRVTLKESFDEIYYDINYNDQQYIKPEFMGSGFESLFKYLPMIQQYQDTTNSLVLLNGALTISTVLDHHRRKYIEDYMKNRFKNKIILTIGEYNFDFETIKITPED